MPDRLAAAYQIHSRIATALRRFEHAPKRPQAPKGMKLLPVMRHRVEGQIVAQVAFPRYLVWRSFILSHVPTRASIKKAAHTMRGVVLARYAAWAQAHGKPLPTNHTPPAWTLLGGQQRADVADNLPPGYLPRPQDVPDDIAAWWDEMGWDMGLPLDVFGDGPSDFTLGAEAAVARAQAARDIEFQQWLSEDLLTNVQVLQLLDGYWNGQANLFAMQEMAAGAGIAGDFDLTDPVMMDFLHQQAGAFVQNGAQAIDELTRQQLGEYLWSGLGGDAAEGVPIMGMDQLAKWLQQGMNDYENSLAKMSDYRARMIAITETARAETMGQFVSMLSMGVKQKQWMVTSGACKICIGNAEQGPIDVMENSQVFQTGIPADLRVVDILQPFPSGHYAPPAHPLCRCSLASVTPDSFSPADWQAPDPAQLQRLFGDPSFAQWPNQVVDLSDPALQLATPDAGTTKYAGQFTYADLPPALQAVIDPAQLANFYGDAWNQAIQAMGRAVNQAANIDATIRAAEEAGYAIGSSGASGGKVLTLDDLLATETPQDLVDFRDALDSTLSDALADFRASLEDLTNGESEE